MLAEANIFALLEDFGEELLTDIDTALKSKGHGSKANGGSQSARIIGTGKFKIIPTDGSITLNFYLNDYWYFLEYGRGKTKAAKTKKEFKNTLAGKMYAAGWDIGKGINAKTWYKKKLKDGSKSKLLKDYEGMRKLLLKAIAHNIHKKGTIKRFGYKGSKFLSGILNDGRFETLSKKLSEIIGKEIVIDISNAFKR